MKVKSCTKEEAIKHASELANRDRPKPKWERIDETNFENQLNVFMTEEHDEDLSKYESCMSMEYKEGWVAISILIDSGASDSVCPPGLFPEVPVYETGASRNGLEYTAAGGGT